MFRWLARIFVAVLVLLMIGAIVVQVVLSSEMPKKIVIAELQERRASHRQSTAHDGIWLLGTRRCAM